MLKTKFLPRPSLSFIAAFSAFWICSCSAKPNLHQVKGQIFVAGKPAEGAIVVFHPVEPSGDRKPSARVGADGSFSLGTFAPADGAMPGDYIVAVAWLGEPNEAYRQANVIPSKSSPLFADPQTSPLRVQVKEGSNEIPPILLSN